MAPVGKSGPRRCSHRASRGQLRVVDERAGRPHDLAQVVRRDVGSHAHGDAGGAVDEQVGQLGRQHRRLHAGAVVVLDEVDGVLVDVGQQLGRDGRHARLGVAHGRRRVAVDGAEVALAIDQRVAQREVLGQADERVVEGLVAVRVVLAHHLADDRGALAVRGARGQAHLVHRVEDPAVDRLEAVAHVRQRPADDHAHGVVEVAVLSSSSMGTERTFPIWSVMRHSSCSGHPGRRRRRSCWRGRAKAAADGGDARGRALGTPADALEPGLSAWPRALAGAWRGHPG